jgi:hypothetical protein
MPGHAGSHHDDGSRGDFSSADVRLLREVEVMQEAMEAMHRGEKSKMGLAFTAMTRRTD